MTVQLEFNFYQCKGFIGKNDVINAISAMRDEGVVLARVSALEGELLKVVPYDGDVTQYVEEVYRAVELVDGKETPIYLRTGPYSASCTGLIHQVIPGRNQRILFSFEMFGKSFNKVGGTLSPRSEDTEAFAQFILKLADKLYRILLPAFGIVDFANVIQGTIFKEVSARKTKRLYWATFFGSEYVNKYGKEYLLNSPVWKKEALQDGGVFLQVNEHLTKPSSVTLLDECKKYFAPIEIKFISWPGEKPRF